MPAHEAPNGPSYEQCSAGFNNSRQKGVTQYTYQQKQTVMMLNKAHCKIMTGRTAKHNRKLKMTPQKRASSLEGLTARKVTSTLDASPIWICLYHQAVLALCAELYTESLMKGAVHEREEATKVH